MVCSLVRVDTGLPFVPLATEIANGDGSFSYQLPSGAYAGQEPNQYGVRNDNDEPKQYQRATKSGNVVTFVPLDGALPCAYLLASGQVYPA